MDIIDAAKQTERIHHVPVPGHRRRRWCSAQDVVAWLRKVKNIKISLKTVQADIRVLKEKTLYAVSAGAFFFGFFQKQLKKMAFWQNFLIIFGAFGRLSKYFAKFGKNGVSPNVAPP